MAYQYQPQGIREHVIKSFTQQELKGKYLTVALTGGSKNLSLMPNGTGVVKSTLDSKNINWSFLAKENYICLVSSTACVYIQPKTGVLSQGGVDVGNITNVSKTPVITSIVDAVLEKPTSAVPITASNINTPVSPGHNTNQTSYIDDGTQLAERVVLGMFAFDPVYQKASEGFVGLGALFTPEGLANTSDMLKKVVVIQLLLTIKFFQLFPHSSLHSCSIVSKTEKS